MSESVTRYEQGPAALLIRRNWCKGCDICIRACPTGILALDENDMIEVTDVDRCIFCGICAVRCPDFVFTLERPEAASVPRATGCGEGGQCQCQS